MRILHLYKTHLLEEPGGVARCVDQLAQGTSAHGHEVDVLFLSRGPARAPISFGNYTAHPVPMNCELSSTGISLSLFSKFSKLARKADLIHYHFPWPMMDVVHFTTRICKPSIVTYHSDVVRQRYMLTLYRPLMERFLKSVDRIVATSPNYRETSDVLRRYGEKTTVIPIGVDQSSYPVPSTDALNHWRARLGDSFFLFVGMLRYYKGLHVLLESARDVGFPIVIAGAGPFEQKLRVHAKHLGLNNVAFLGSVPEEDKAALFSLCSAVVFPSNIRSEAFGISLVEGAMYGKPLISTEIGTGTSFINVHGETGLVVPPSDPAALAHAMNYLIENRSVARKMGQGARSRYERQFTGVTMVQQYLDLYQRMLT